MLDYKANKNVFSYFKTFLTSYIIYIHIAFVISGKIIIIITFNANMSTTFDPLRIGQCVKPEYQRCGLSTTHQPFMADGV